MGAVVVGRRLVVRVVPLLEALLELLQPLLRLRPHRPRQVLRENRATLLHYGNVASCM